MGQVIQQGNYFKFTQVDLIKIVDGDTFDFRTTVDCGFHHFNLDVNRFRVKDFDAPETSKRNNPNVSDAEIEHGLQAKQAATDLLAIGISSITTYKDPRVYDRWEAVIELKDGKDFASTMRELGMEKKKHY